MQQALTVIDLLLTNLLSSAPLDTATREVAIGHVSRVVGESKEMLTHGEDVMVDLAVAVRCLVLLTQLQGLLGERDDYPDLIQDVEAHIAVEQLTAWTGVA